MLPAQDTDAEEQSRLTFVYRQLVRLVDMRP